MTRLVTTIRLRIDGETVDLRPSLRAAFTLAREFGSFSPILKGIGESNVAIMGRLFEVCSDYELSPDDPFMVSERSLAGQIAKLQPCALSLVYGLLGVDPGAKEEDTAKNGTSKPVGLVEHYEGLFGFATGILRWTPEAVWNAAPAEIMVAHDYRADAFMSPEDRAKKEMASLPAAERVRRQFAMIGTRREIDAG